MQNIILSENVPLVIDIDTLKSHLRIEHSDEDDYLKAVIRMATAVIEERLSKSLIIKEYRFSYYPIANNEAYKVKLPINNITKITSVLQSDKPVEYIFQRDFNEIILLQSLFDYPIYIKYTAGISDNSHCIPEELKLVVLHTAKNIYDCSEENVLESKYIKNIIQRHYHFEL